MERTSRYLFIMKSMTNYCFEEINNGFVHPSNQITRYPSCYQVSTIGSKQIFSNKICRYHNEIVQHGILLINTLLFGLRDNPSKLFQAQLAIAVKVQHCGVHMPTAAARPVKRRLESLSVFRATPRPPRPPRPSALLAYTTELEAKRRAQLNRSLMNSSACWFAARAYLLNFV